MYPQAPNAVVLAAPTQVILSNRDALKCEILAQLALDRDVILDLHDTLHVDSSGLGMLVSVARSFDVAQRGLVVCRLQADVALIFNLTQIDQRLHITRHLAEAADKLSPDAPPPAGHEAAAVAAAVRAPLSPGSAQPVLQRGVTVL